MRLNVKNIINCPGGKLKLLPFLIPLIEHTARTYSLDGFLETNGGSAKTLFNLNTQQFKYRLYNEYERGLTNLVACMSDKTKTEELVKTIEELLQKYEPEDWDDTPEDSLDSPESRELFKIAFDRKDDEKTDMVLSAAYTFITVHGSFRSNRKSYGGQGYKKLIERKIYLKLQEFNGILKNIVVTNGDCLDLLKYYKKRSGFIALVDPPYYQTDVYKQNWKDIDYINLVEVMKETDMKIILCDYTNPFYD